MQLKKYESTRWTGNTMKEEGAGGFAFQEPENAPYRRLYQASAGGFLEMGMAKEKRRAEREKNLAMEMNKKNEEPIIQSSEQRKSELRSRMEVAKKKLEEQKGKLEAKRGRQKLEKLQKKQEIKEIAQSIEPEKLQVKEELPFEGNKNPEERFAVYELIQPLQKPSQIVRRKKSQEKALKKSLKQLHNALMNVSARLR